MSRQESWLLPGRKHRLRHTPAGANIESLAVGLNIDKALFTIEVTGPRQTVVRTRALSRRCCVFSEQADPGWPVSQANLVKQLGKLLKVRYVEDITSARRVGEAQSPFPVLHERLPASFGVQQRNAYEPVSVPCTRAQLIRPCLCLQSGS